MSVGVWSDCIGDPGSELYSAFLTSCSCFGSDARRNGCRTGFGFACRLWGHPLPIGTGFLFPMGLAVISGGTAGVPGFILVQLLTPDGLIPRGLVNVEGAGANALGSVGGPFERTGAGPNRRCVGRLGANGGRGCGGPLGIGWKPFGSVDDSGGLEKSGWTGKSSIFILELEAGDDGAR